MLKPRGHREKVKNKRRQTGRRGSLHYSALPSSIIAASQLCSRLPRRLTTRRRRRTDRRDIRVDRRAPETADIGSPRKPPERKHATPGAPAPPLARPGPTPRHLLRPGVRRRRPRDGPRRLAPYQRRTDPRRPVDPARRPVRPDVAPWRLRDSVDRRGGGPLQHTVGPHDHPGGRVRPVRGPGRRRGVRHDRLCDRRVRRRDERVRAVPPGPA